ncbi:50S ribosomal protein L7/L12 [candidate division WOR-3 bacterium 4484_100]|uniref:Large ribosomal subunit protein bL12 n=1 Tax=candidate division WOR-3 bacterium 4484_100 TaxID=1936077 RepID=A0A1V4QF94_UNCW3|nr:MAG: 50S ribosomal protein L7/L12 [candidate division WOR-3 bacterium 4484_100]
MTAKAKKGVDAIVEEIGNLSVLELSELVKALQEKFGVSAAAPVQVAVAQAGAEAAPKAEEKSEFTVRMTSCGDKKIQVLKVLRELTGLGLKEAKEMIDNLPRDIKEGIPKEEAENMKSKLEEVGATVELK